MKNIVYISKWWEKYKKEVADQPNILELANRIDALENNRSRAAIDATRTEIAANCLSKHHQDNLERRLRVYDRRVKLEVNENFGSFVKKRRLRLGLSQNRVGDIAKVSPTYITRLEKGQRAAPSREVLEGLAEALLMDSSSLHSIAHREVTANTIVPELWEYLFIGDFAIKGVLTDRETKDAMSNVLSLIFESKWDENSKLKDSLKIIESINSLKYLLAKKNKDIEDLA